ncbi:hypothetical protein G7Z17_g13068 [Cylindrodendrum hubeiense]|uniref:Uncharacterized protein n=1 Tax=Cylindrodendrum hubeiense TaxID=595255 RepID=A0A9P5L8L9_9HYPO|nr:hypothetical protein G7Z17_g13068 [Cylindrodendrum hubeiense]
MRGFPDTGEAQTHPTRYGYSQREPRPTERFPGMPWMPPMDATAWIHLVRSSLRDMTHFNSLGRYLLAPWHSRVPNSPKRWQSPHRTQSQAGCMAGLSPVPSLRLAPPNRTIISRQQSNKQQPMPPSSAAKPVASLAIPGGHPAPLSAPSQPSYSAQRLCACCTNGELDVVRGRGSPALSTFVWSLRGNTLARSKGPPSNPRGLGVGGGALGPGHKALSPGESRCACWGLGAGIRFGSRAVLAWSPTRDTKIAASRSRISLLLT